MILFVTMIGLSMAVIAYFNVGVFRLSFLADEEQRLRHLGQQVSENLIPYLGIDFTSERLAQDALSTESLDRSKLPGLRYYELWDAQGKVLFRSGRHSADLPLREALVRRMQGQPLPTHFFLDHRLGDKPGMVSPYAESLPISAFQGSNQVSYEFLLPIFRQQDKMGTSPRRVPSATLGAILHLSFDVDSSSRRLNLVIAGNVLLGLTFLLTSLMAVHLWSQHAISRPLQGLIASMRQFGTSGQNVELASSNELINLSQTLHHLALERLKYQRELEGLNRDLEAQVQEKTKEMKEFFSLVTHDLRIPLAAIQGYADLLKRKPDSLSPRHMTYVDRIATANAHALDLVRNLLEAMKIEFGTFQPVMEVFAFQRLAEEVRDQLNVHAGLPPVVLQPCEGLDETLQVEADRTRIKRVLTNLLSNAQRYAEGTPQVSLGWKFVTGKGLEVCVTDRGPGIPLDQQDRLFEKFTRAPGSMGGSSGLGLGLYIVDRILDSHHQKITLTSEVGKGTTFEFCLPVVASPGASPGESGLGSESPT